MGFRAKHRRANWIPERLAKSEARQALDDARKDGDLIRKANGEKGLGRADAVT